MDLSAGSGARQTIHEAIGAGALKRDYSKIRVPILALFLRALFKTCGRQLRMS